MNAEIVIELIRLVPTLLWIGLILLVVWLLRAQLRSRMSDLSGLKVGMSGVEATFLVHELEKAEAAKAADAPPATQQTNQEAHSASGPGAARQTRDDRSLVIRRAERNEVALRGARLLWVDDHPRNNEHLINILESLGVDVTIALGTDEALALIARRRFDLIITDQGRGMDRAAGTNLLRAIREEGRHPSVIFYTGRPMEPLPPGAFGGATMPDQLLHLVLDVLERERG